MRPGADPDCTPSRQSVKPTLLHGMYPTLVLDPSVARFARLRYNPHKVASEDPLQPGLDRGGIYPTL